MKKIKIVVILFVVVILSGCSATDTVSITKSGKIKESTKILEENGYVLYGNSSLEESIDDALAEYSHALDLRKYNVKKVVKSELSGVRITNTYNDFCEFINKTVFSQYLYKHISCTLEDGYYIVESSGDFITHSSYDEGFYPPQAMTFKLKLPFSLVENNADKIDNNTYTWRYDEDTSSDKKLYFKVRKSDIDKIKKDYAKYAKRTNLIKKVITIFVCILIVIGLGVGAYYLYKKAEKNKLDY